MCYAAQTRKIRLQSGGRASGAFPIYMAAGLPGRAQYPRRGSIPRAMNYISIKERIPLAKTEIITATGRTREEITASVRIHMRSMVNNALEIGMDLIDMKDACQHGEWLPWLKEIGLSASTAANYMRIAREVNGDSKMAQLPYTKILALMAAPKEDREALAEVAGDMSAAEIRRLTEERNRAAEAANSETARADQAEADAKHFNQVNAGLRTEMQNLQAKLEKARDGQKQAEAGCDILKGTVEKQQDIINDLKEKLIFAENNRVEVEVIPEDYEKMKRERQELIDAAADAEARAAEAEAALEEAQNGQPDGPDEPWKILKTAMTRFMADCEMMPLDPQGLIRNEHKINAYLERLDKWGDQMRMAMAKAVSAEGAVV